MKEKESEAFKFKTKIIEMGPGCNQEEKKNSSFSGFWLKDNKFVLDDYLKSSTQINMKDQGKLFHFDVKHQMKWLLLRMPIQKECF